MKTNGNFSLYSITDNDENQTCELFSSIVNGSQTSGHVRSFIEH